MQNRFSFPTSWGPEVVDGGAQFRLWAPHAEQVELMAGEIEDALRLPMTRDDAGWWRLTTDSVPLGGAYGFSVNGGRTVPDPASRRQMFDVHGRSRLVDPHAYEWRKTDWRGRPWHECVFYEMHVGTFTREGTFDAAISHLDHLRDCGITAIELMPVAEFGGHRGWGYDGVLLYCPHGIYGGYDGLKRLVDAAHERGLTVFLDVVYNHFGPDGNYIPTYLPDFFHEEVHTPWGPAIAYDEQPVRNFMIDNALYWLEEFRLDGLRLDAIDSIIDASELPLVEELAARVRATITDRHVHLTSEDARNITRFIERKGQAPIPLVSGEWNDDFHHAAHVLTTYEQEGYYQDYDPVGVEQLAKALASGFVYQGEHSQHRGRLVGETSEHLPPTAFVNFLQNHDQIGNRAFGERLRDLASARAYDCLQAILLLSPQIPLMFQGDEFGECNPFCYFTNLDGELGAAVSRGRKAEFKYFKAFEDPRAQDVFPDPNSETTFLASRLDWSLLDRAVNRRRMQVTQELLAARREFLFDLLAEAPGNCGAALVQGRSFVVSWQLSKDVFYHCFANLSDDDWEIGQEFQAHLVADSTPVYGSHRETIDNLQLGLVQGYSVAFILSKHDLTEGLPE
ncbi:malto-oligosyltrehalose trehalohydrolase [Aureimonas fodinaquatilis]|uniref:Malto-oligosyltrehalose trehalohydrolase n=1 Tax=Aureimonas fodinaquatilis TaxID=2565783 RepID=A0A5B0DQ86_9HYPH|nr:malto-oligosyltrehalose trehalohydrolase [Aureimonas fodinaquatilis]KAA0968944.1 malto-oligosyltrehalose trehalohydrolase [Aureimonas fodinaquatilis]